MHIHSHFTVGRNRGFGDIGGLESRHHSDFGLVGSVLLTYILRKIDITEIRKFRSLASKNCF